MILCRKRGETLETLGGIGLAQGRVHSHALVENKTLSIVVRTAAFLEVFQDAAVELMDISKALAFHVGPCLLTANAAGAKHHHGLVFEGLGKLSDCLWKIPEMVDTCWERSTKSPEFDLVVVACVEKRDLAAFIEPLFERGSV